MVCAVFDMRCLVNVQLSFAAAGETDKLRVELFQLCAASLFFETIHTFMQSIQNERDREVLYGLDTMITFFQSFEGEIVKILQCTALDSEVCDYFPVR